MVDFRECQRQHLRSCCCESEKKREGERECVTCLQNPRGDWERGCLAVMEPAETVSHRVSISRCGNGIQVAVSALDRARTICLIFPLVVSGTQPSLLHMNRVLV